MSFEFLAPFGNEQKTVRIISPSGSGTTYNIFIDNYFKGSMHRQMHGWAVYFNSGEFNSADADCLLEYMESVGAL